MEAKNKHPSITSSDIRALKSYLFQGKTQKETIKSAKQEKNYE